MDLRTSSTGLTLEHTHQFYQNFEKTTTMNFYHLKYIEFVCRTT